MHFVQTNSSIYYLFTKKAQNTFLYNVLITLHTIYTFLFYLINSSYFKKNKIVYVIKSEKFDGVYWTVP